MNMSTKSEWEVFRNPGFGYFIARIKDPNEPCHSGNLERLDDIFYQNKGEAQAVTDSANREEGVA